MLVDRRAKGKRMAAPIWVAVKKHYEQLTLMAFLCPQVIKTKSTHRGRIFWSSGTKAECMGSGPVAGYAAPFMYSLGYRDPRFRTWATGSARILSAFDGYVVNFLQSFL